MPIAENDLIRVDARAEYADGQDVINVYQVRVSWVLTPTEQEIIDDVLDWVDDLHGIIDALQKVSFQYRDVKLFNITQDVLLGTFNWPTMNNGNDGGTTLPQGVAARIQLNTAVPRVLLSKYFGGFTEESIDSGGLWDATIVAALTTVGAYLLAEQAMTNIEINYGYFSPKVAAFVTPTGVTLNNIPAYQRRRKPGVGS